MRSSTSSTSDTWTSNDLSNSIAVSAHLLNHKWSLSDCLESLSTAASASNWGCSWLRFRTFASATNISSWKGHSFLRTIHCIHEIDLHVEHNVLSFGLSMSSSTSWSSTTKHLLKLFENVAKWRTTWSLTPSKLLLEAFKAFESCETLSKWSISTSEWILCLLISRHSSLVINCALGLITKSLISSANFRKLFFSFWRIINIRMVFFSQLEITLFNVCLWSISLNIKNWVEIVIITSAESASTPAIITSKTTIVFLNKNVIVILSQIRLTQTSHICDTCPPTDNKKVSHRNLNLSHAIWTFLRNTARYKSIQTWKCFLSLLHLNTSNQEEKMSCSFK